MADPEVLELTDDRANALGCPVCHTVLSPEPFEVVVNEVWRAIEYPVNGGCPTFPAGTAFRTRNGRDEYLALTDTFPFWRCPSCFSETSRPLALYLEPDED
jgi:hypothetical protein